MWLCHIPLLLTLQKGMWGIMMTGNLARGKGRINKNHYGYIFTAPFIIIYIVFSLYPLLYTFYLSFTNMTVMGGSNYDFIGLDNYIKLFDDDFFTTSVKNTWKIWLMNFIPQMGIAMLLSVWFMSQRLKIRFLGLWRTVYYLPNLLMPVAVATLFFNLFHMYGPVNQVLVRLGISDKSIDFFRSSGWTQSILPRILACTYLLLTI